MDEDNLAANVRLHNAWIRALVGRVVFETMNQGYVVLDEIDPYKAEARARENFEMALGLPKDSLKIDGSY